MQLGTTNKSFVGMQRARHISMAWCIAALSLERNFQTISQRYGDYFDLFVGKKFNGLNIY